MFSNIPCLKTLLCLKAHRKTLAIALAIPMVLVSCSSSSKNAKFAYVERPVEQLYSSAAGRLESRRYPEAIQLFEEVERQHPFTEWARRATLMKAFTLYQKNDYEESIAAVDQFIALHPGNKNIPYAYYLKSMCFYERIRDVGRDQDYTDNAVAALTDVVRRAPDTEYARDARLKLDLTYDHLAGKEMYVGRFYLKQNKHIAAINRFKYVINNYQTTSHTAEALHRLVEAYLELGIVDEAKANAAVLGFNYPGTRWYSDTYKLFKRRGLVENGESLAENDVSTIPAALDTSTAPINPQPALPTIAPPVSSSSEATVVGALTTGENG